MIDITAHPHRLDETIAASLRVARKRREPPRAVLVDEATFAEVARRDDAITIDGWLYVGYVPIETDPKAAPPPRPKPKPPKPPHLERPLAEVKAARAADLVAEVEAAVEAAYPGRELTMLMRDFGVALRVDVADIGAAAPETQAVFWGLGVADAWVSEVRRIGAQAEDAVADAKDATAVAAVEVATALAALGPAPALRGRDTLAALDAVRK